MSKAEPFVMQSIFLLIVWVGGYLRVPGALGSFTVRSKSKLEREDVGEALAV
jgi:hypothetical protein